MHPKDVDGIANSAHPDQAAPAQMFYFFLIQWHIVEIWENASLFNTFSSTSCHI